MEDSWGSSVAIGADGGRISFFDPHSILSNGDRILRPRFAIRKTLWDTCSSGWRRHRRRRRETRGRTLERAARACRSSAEEPTMIQSVDRALRILAVLQGDHRLTLGEIAQRLELPPSTVHGILRTLLAHRVVVQEHDSGRYRLGPAVLTMGNVYLDTLELRSRVTPWAEDLARRTGLAVRTAVMLVDDVVVVHHEPRPDGSRQMPEVGIVIPAHASALGKAILAFDDELAEELL